MEKMNLSLTCNYNELEQKSIMIQQFLKDTYCPCAKDKIILQLQLLEDEPEMSTSDEKKDLLLTIPDASKLYHIGETRLRNLLVEHKELCFMNGSKTLIKREKMDEFVMNSSAI